MAAMTGEEFQNTVMNDRDTQMYTVEEFGVVAASIAATVSIAPEKFTKEILVETIQQMALRMPTELVMAGTLHAMEVAARRDRGLTG